MSASSIVFLMLFGAQSPVVTIDQFGDDLSGVVLCFNPDDRRMGCSAIIRYRQTGDGIYEEISEVPIAGVDGLTIRKVAVAQLKDGTLCSRMDPDYSANAQLFVHGEPVPDARARSILKQLQPMLAAGVGKVTCTSFSPGRTDMISRSAPEGDPYNAFDMPARWVGAADGYTVQLPNSLAPVQ